MKSGVAQPVECEEEPSARSERPVNPGNVDEERGGAPSIGRLMRNPSQYPIEYSHVRRQENTQNADSWKQEDRDES